VGEDTRADRERVVSRRGDTCIFREGLLVFPSVVESAASDTQGVHLGLQAVKRSGFVYPRKAHLDIGVASGFGSIGGSVWSGGQGAAWVLYFDPDLIRSLEEVALEVCGLHVHKRSFHLRSYPNEFGHQRPNRVLRREW
jgi:hypothetical protein